MVGAKASTDNIQIFANDGNIWSTQPVLLKITNSANVAAKVAATTAQLLANGESVNLSTLFTTTDPEGDVITQYRIKDNAPKSLGTLYINGEAVSSNKAMIIDANDIAGVTYLGNNPAATNAFKNIVVAAYDGTNWSSDTAIAIGNKGNNAPIITPLQVQTLAYAKSLEVNSLFTAADNDGSTNATIGTTIQQYMIVDSSKGIQLNDATNLSTKAGTYIVSADDIGKLTYVNSNATTKLVAATVQISAFDGVSWSKATAITIKNDNNHAAAITVGTIVPMSNFNTINLATLFSAADEDGDVVVGYKIVDPSGLGSVQLNGATNLSTVAGTYIVSAEDMANITYQAFNSTKSNGTDKLQIFASDGIVWSKAYSLNIINNGDKAPIVSVVPQASLNVGDTLNVGELFSTTDAENDPITAYKIVSNSGFLKLNGAKNLSKDSNTYIVSADDIGTLTYVDSNPNHPTIKDTLQISAFDGAVWGLASKLTLNNNGVNHSSTISQTTIPTMNAGTTINLNSVFKVVDVDSDKPVQYTIVDKSGIGQINLGGAKNLSTDAGTYIVSGADFAKMKVITHPPLGVQLAGHSMGGNF